MSATEISTLITGLTSLKNMFESFLKKEDAKVLQVQEKPLRRISITTEIAKTTSEIYDSNKPALVIQNIDGFSKIKEMSIAPDTNFKIKGLLRILVDDVIVYELKSLEVFPIIDIQTMLFPQGLPIKRDVKIKFLLISSDGSEVKLAVTLTLTD